MLLALTSRLPFSFSFDKKRRGREIERCAVEMAGPRDKGKAKASRTGDAPIKRLRCGAAAAALLIGPEVAARSGGSVHTKEKEFDVAHKLRSGRRVLVPNTNKSGPLCFRKREKDYGVSWQIPAHVKVALEHYNRLNEEDVHELVKAVDGYVFLFNGAWLHVNFIAKSKQGTPKAFFAELKIEGPQEASCTMCTEMDPADPKTAPVRGVCGGCPSRIFHPAAGGHMGTNGGFPAEYLGAAPGGGSEEFASLCNAELL